MRRAIFRLMSVSAVSILVLGGRQVLAQEFMFGVEHDHLIGSCKGDLIVRGSGVEYRTSHTHARRWTYAEIKMIKVVSRRNVEVLTYESDGVKLGRDRTFEFKLTKAEITSVVSEFLLDRVSKPLATSLVKSEEKSAYEMPARHRHSFGGCQGTIRIYGDRVVYESARPENSGLWRWTDIRAISRTNPYQLSITSYEPKMGGPTKTYNFDLKERMSDAVYDYLWSRIYNVALPALLEGGKSRVRN